MSEVWEHFTAGGLGSAIFVMSQKICHHLKSPLARGEGFRHLQLDWSLLVSNRRTADQTRTVTNSKGKRLTRSNRKTTPWRLAWCKMIGANGWI